MKWRCTWCGKPHAENDPPCDNCGHNKFEKAIVREDERSESSETGAGAERHASRQDERSDSAETGAGADATGSERREGPGTAGGGAATGATGDIDPETGTVDTGTSYVWRCTNCGRDHVKFNPPCSRCGEHDLEKIEQSYDDIDDELETSSWLEVAKPYTPILAAFLVIVALFATGIVPLSIIPGVGAPSPPDAPGEASEAAGIDLEETELEIHERLEEERDASRSYDDDLAAYAEYANRAYVLYELEGERSESVSPDDFGADCSDPVGGRVPVSLSIDDYDDEEALADDLASGLATIDAVTDPAYDGEGLDLHVADGTVYTHYAAC